MDQCNRCYQLLLYFLISIVHTTQLSVLASTWRFSLAPRAHSAHGHGRLAGLGTSHSLGIAPSDWWKLVFDYPSLIAFQVGQFWVCSILALREFPGRFILQLPNGNSLDNTPVVAWMSVSCTIYVLKHNLQCDDIWGLGGVIHHDWDWCPYKRSQRAPLSFHHVRT